MKFWDYDFWLKITYIVACVVVAIYFDSPWFMFAMLFLPLVEV